MSIIPAEALKNHIALLGKTGAGKSSTGRLLIEKMVAEDFRVCILDTIKSDWWGIVSNASGKQAGLPFKILGGPRGHVPLHSSAGKVIGNLVGSGKLPLSVIDMADFEAGGIQRFFVDFAPALMRSMRGVLYLVIEEAHELAPKERAGFGAENMALHWAKKIATAGRSKGIRLIVATQRIQALHNAVLGSCETIIAHRLSAPADQEPVVKWLKANTDKETEAKVSGSLSSLPTGTGWVCSGEAKAFELTKFPKFKTYDNMATPIGDSEEITVKTAPVDQDELRSIIGDAVAEAEANDPAKLKAQIRELQKSAAAPASDNRAIVRAQADGIKEGYNLAMGEIERLYFPGEMRVLADKIAKLVTGLKFKPERSQLPKVAAPVPALRQRPLHKPVAPASPAGDLPRAQQRVVDALGFWLSVGAPAASRAQVAAVSGYSVKSSGFDKTLSQLSTAGVVSRPTSGALTLVDQSKAILMDAGEARARLLSVLGPAQRRVLGAFNAAAATREEIAERSNYSNTSSGFDKTLSQLSSIGVVTRPAPGMLDLADWVREILE
jgi:hypothetical protein